MDAISLKALCHKQHDRCASVRDFAGDIQHYLNGYTIAARQGQTAYRIGKYVRRHKLAMGGVGAGFSH